MFSHNIEFPREKVNMEKKLEKYKEAILLSSKKRERPKKRVGPSQAKDRQHRH